MGMGIKVINDNSQLVENINVKMKTKEIIFPVISIIPDENTSVIASRSETTLVTSAPTGVLSKNESEMRLFF